MGATALDWLTESTEDAPHRAGHHHPAASHDDIEKLAYELWEQRQRNGLDGSAEQDWFDAERQLHPGERILGE